MTDGFPVFSFLYVFEKP